MYSKGFKTERYEAVQTILDQMATLEPGGQVRVKGLTSEQRSRAKYLIYDWLHHMNLKKLYRLRDFDKTITISQIDLPKYQVEVEERPLTAKQDEILGQLLMKDEVSVDSLLARFVEGGEIKPNEKGVIKARWLKVMA